MNKQHSLPKIFIPICDQNLWILKMFSHLFTKFWGNEYPVVIMGFGKPDFELPNNFTFVSMAKEQNGGSKKWTRYIHDYLASIEDEYIIFCLEDFFPTQKPNIKLLNKIFDYMKENQNVGRFDLTWDSFINVFDRSNRAKVSNSYKRVTNIDDSVVIDIPKLAPYRISTQPALWRKEYILEFLNNDWSPWDFEIMGTQKSYLMDKSVQAIADSKFVKYPTKWIHKGAISRFHEGKVNVLGLDFETIKELVQDGFVTRENMQWGQWNGKVPSFEELGGYDFHPSKMPEHDASPTNWREYEPTYDVEKTIINLFDKTFSHTKDLWGYITATGVKMWGKPRKVEFIQNRMKYDGITFFVDEYISNVDLVKAVDSKYKVAWLLEPRELKPQGYQTIENHSQLFDLVITHDKHLIEKFANCIHIQQAECRVAHKDWGIHDKSKMVSLIAANKKIMEGHRFRFKVAEQLHGKHKFDLFGEAFDNYFENKTDALKDYFFSITIHNTIQDNFFTDGIVDCFALGTIPIFRGCPNIEQFFDINGIITFNTIEELDEILSNLTEEDYYSKIESVKKNYEISKRFKRTNEDQIIGKVIDYFREKDERRK
tara:strand:- start:509 stop:2302 length:1794 start_codon:yes stop_codon:yes gene_type:complete